MLVFFFFLIFFIFFYVCFFFNDTATTEIYTLSLHDALPISARGARIFQQDSDGDVNSVIPAFLAAGLTCMCPMEPAAGMDIVAVRDQYGQRLMLRGEIGRAHV